MVRKGRLIKHQEIGGTNRSGSEASPYWNYMKGYSGGLGDNNILENKFANPDVLADEPENKLWGNGSKPVLAELIIERFANEKGQFPILSKMENKVLALYIRRGDISEVCKILKISRSSCNTYMARISKKFKRLLPALNY